MMDEETASDLKSQLKKWESEFYKEHRRKPSKDDISEAGKDIQEKYKKYNTLKRTLQNVDVWGAELNRTAEKEAKKAEKEEQNNPSFRIGNKLWESAKIASASKPRPKSSSFKRLSLPFAKDENLSAGPVNSPRLSLGGKWVKEDTPRPQVVKSRLIPSSEPPPPIPSFTSPEPKASKDLPSATLLDEDLVMQPKKGSMFEKALRWTQSAKKPNHVAAVPTNDVYVPVVKKSQLSSFRNIDTDFLNQVKESFENEMEEINVPTESETCHLPSKIKSPLAETVALDNNNKSQLDNNLKNDISPSIRETHKTEEGMNESQDASEIQSTRRGSKRKVSDSPSPKQPQTVEEFAFDEMDDPFACPGKDPAEVRTSKKPRTEAGPRVGSLLTEGNKTDLTAPRPPVGVSIIRDGNVERPKSQDLTGTNAGKDDEEDDADNEKAKTKKKKVPTATLR